MKSCDVGLFHNQVVELVVVVLGGGGGGGGNGGDILGKVWVDGTLPAGAFLG